MKLEDFNIRTSHLNTDIAHLVKLLKNDMIDYREYYVSDELISQFNRLLDLNIQFNIKLMMYTRGTNESDELTYYTIDGDRILSIIDYLFNKSDNLVNRKNIESKSIVLCFIHIFKISKPLKLSIIKDIQQYIKTSLELIQ